MYFVMQLSFKIRFSAAHRYHRSAEIYDWQWAGREASHLVPISTLPERWLHQLACQRRRRGPYFSGASMRQSAYVHRVHRRQAAGAMKHIDQRPPARRPISPSVVNA